MILAAAVLLWVLLAIVVALLVYVGYLLKKLKDAGGSGPSVPGASALEDLGEILEELNEERRGPTAEECAEMRRLLEQARSGGVGSVALAPAVSAVRELCD